MKEKKMIRLLEAIYDAADAVIYKQLEDGIEICVEPDERYQAYVDASNAYEHATGKAELAIAADDPDRDVLERIAEADDNNLFSTLSQAITALGRRVGEIEKVLAPPDTDKGSAGGPVTTWSPDEFEAGARGRMFPYLGPGAKGDGKP